MRAEVVSYGDPRKTFFKTATLTSDRTPIAMEGQSIELCFEDVVWERICRSRLVTYFTPARGPRIDLPTYDINAPGGVKLPHRVPPKCRAWTVPNLGPYREAGVGVMSGYAESECSPLDHWRPIVTPLPAVKLFVSRRPAS